MNSSKWNFVGGHGKVSTIVLKHGVKSGNLIIFCNSKILLIDYDVFEDKSHSFFIEEEFCQIFIEKKKKGFTYNFEVSEEVDTPLNQKRKEYYSKKLRDTIFKALLSVFLVMTLVISSIGYKKYLQVQDLKNHPLVTTVKLKILEGDWERRHNTFLYYNFKNTTYKDRMDLPTTSSGVILTESGMPLENFDEFNVIFSYKNPYNRRIEFDKPTFWQLSKYEIRIAHKLRQLMPSISPTKCECIISAVFQEKGVRGLADLYFQDASPKENKYNNSKTYQRLIQMPSLNAALNACDQF